MKQFLMAVASIALVATCAANVSVRPDTSESTNAATTVLQSAQPSAKPDLVAELKSVEIDGGNYEQMPICSIARDIQERANDALDSLGK